LSETDERQQALIARLMDLAKSNEELERFAFVAAHDLREPLRSIQAMTEVFLERNGSTLDTESSQLLTSMLKSAHRMRRLIKDLLDFATLGKEAKITRIETSAVANLAVRELRKAVEESGATIEIAPLPPIDTNEEQLTSLFQNLIGNAIKYRKEDPPEIRISASMAAGELIFSVSDNGIGIEPEYHEQIFDPFQRLHGASEYEGSGVGLAICKRIVAMHNGRIWVESEPGHGSKFCFTIPGARSFDVRSPTVDGTPAQSITHSRTFAATGDG
jgi:light-regulated signal transduction histidine kinase (bacteriophytochrome)